MRMVEENSLGSQDNGLLFEVKGNSLDDGPGIRTVIFFKGCPLDCLWCHNPESKKTEIELSFDKEKCIGCGSCIAACTEKALDRNYTCFIDREACTLCMKCTDACPGGALSQVGRFWGLDELMFEIEKDLPFFQASGGGITLSGGEPTLYMDFASRFLQRAKAMGISTLLETCGLFDYERFLTSLSPYLDIIYYDIKLFGAEEHKRYCGVSNTRILKNFADLSRACIDAGIELLPRIPLVPGITATHENLLSIARFLKGLGIAKVELLPYNPLWLSKLETLGQHSEASHTDSMKDWMAVPLVEQCKRLFEGFDVR